MAEINAVGGPRNAGRDSTPREPLWLNCLTIIRPPSPLCWRHPLLDALGLAELLQSKSIERLDYDVLQARDTVQQRNDMLAADVGVSSATLAIAETGTLAMASGPGTERAANLLPPVHIAIELPSRSCPICSTFSRSSSACRRMPSSWVLITGPSKTGDLEFKLTTGVHGPGNWHVIVVRDSS